MGSPSLGCKKSSQLKLESPKQLHMLVLQLAWVSNNTRNNGRSYVEVAIARQLRLPAVMARGRAGRWPGAPRGKWRAHGIMRNAEGRINATAIRRIIMFLNLTGPHRRVAGVRAVVAPHWPPPRPTGAGRAPARGSLARISMNPLPALPSTRGRSRPNLF